MTSTYVPQPGTIAARAVAIVMSLPDGQSIANVALAEQLGQDASLVNVGMEAPARHGLVECVRNGRLVSWRRGSGVPRSAPAATDDEVDDAPIVQRVVPASKSAGVSLLDRPAWSASKEATMATPAPIPPQPKKPRAAPVEFDPLAIELKQRPLPPAITGAGSRYQALLERMKVGDSIDVAPAIAKGLVSAAKKAKVKLATRVLSETVTGVWRL